ncbi:ATP-dependent nuclease subunit B [Lacticaseibacillus paracasei]|nr:ATP-dependent nuclease subunit B [Lacticaseibacillus paracasei]MCT3332222.1 ATP-dependent nuclease subunit B [Lacticaseibacillus paracasei]
MLTRSPPQKPACKNLGCNGQNPTITPKVTYTPVSNRAASRSQKKASSTTELAIYITIMLAEDPFLCQHLCS